MATREGTGPPRAVLGLIAGLGVLAVGSAFLAPRLDGTAPAVSWVSLPGLVLALIAGGYLHVDFRHGKEDIDAIDLFEASLAPALFVLPAWLVVVLAAGTKATAESMLRIEPVKAAFNTAAWAAAAGVGSLVLAAGTSGEREVADLAWLVAALLAVAVVNKTSFVTVLALAQRTTLARTVRRAAPTIGPGWVAGGIGSLAFGLLFAASYRWAPVTAWLFPVPLLALHWAGRGYAASRADLHRVEGLHRASRALTADVPLELALNRFLQEVQRLFAGGAVDVIALHGRDAVVHSVTERSDDLAGPEAADAARPDSPRVLAAAAVEPLLRLPAGARVTSGEGGAVRDALRPEGWRSCLIAPIRSAGTTRGALCVYDASGLAAFDEADLVVVEALAVDLAGTLERTAAHDELRRSEARFRGLVQRSSDMVTVLDDAGVITEIVPSWQRSSPTGLTARVGQPVVEVAHPDDAALVRSVLEALRRRPGAVETLRWRARACDGSWRQVETVATNLLADPAVAGLVLTSRDITERERAASLMAAQAEVLGVIARQSPLPDVVREIAEAVAAQVAGARYTVVMAASPAGPVTVLGERLSGKVLDEVMDTLTDHVTGSDTGRRDLFVTDVRADPAWRDRDDSGELGALWAAPIEAADGDGVVGCSILHFTRPRIPDDFDRRLLEATAHLAHIGIEGATSQARLVHQASHDPLTGLPNRRLFLDRTAMALSRLARTNRSLAVLFVDLDRFKAVNDTLGHEAGDQLLNELAHRLRRVMRPSDTVARFGGDEFTILCEDIHGPVEAAAIATRVRDAMAAPVHLAGEDVYMTASIGIAHTDDPTRRPQELVDDADAAMYRSKQAGGNHYRVYEATMRSQTRGSWASAQALREALDRDELRVYYQPTVSLDTGKVLGAEALVRWEHPELGLIEPGQFIPLAEETGLIVPLGRVVLAHACRETTRWQASDPGFVMSVNLSARQFTDPTLVDSVAEALEHAGTTPGSLALEITESVLMENADTTMASLRELKDLGVGLAIDDFGTGYSSFTYLKRFPVDTIKVDRTFVSGLGNDPNDEAIVGAVVSLADTLGMTTVAEGVETFDQVRMLQSLGCGVAQGFYFSRAVPPESFDPAVPAWEV